MSTPWEFYNVGDAILSESWASSHQGTTGWCDGMALTVESLSSGGAPITGPGSVPVSRRYYRLAPDSPLTVPGHSVPKPGRNPSVLEEGLSTVLRPVSDSGVQRSHSRHQGRLK